MEKPRVIIVDDEDTEIGLKYRDEIDYRVDRYRCTGLCLTNSKGEVLIAQRRLTKDKDPGKWGPAVSGTVEEGETYLSNIYKEAEEELGLTGLVFETGPRIKNEVPRKNFAQWFTAVCDIPLESFVLQEDEVEQVKWIAPHALLRDIEENADDYVATFIPFLALVR